MMGRSFGYRTARFFAMVAVCLQVILPGAVPLAQAHGIDLARYICAPLGQDLDVDTRAAALRLAALVGDEDETPAPILLNGGCPLCVLAHSVILSEPALLAEPIQASEEAYIFPVAEAPRHAALGPTLGSRGPPAHI